MASIKILENTSAPYTTNDESPLLGQLHLRFYSRRPPRNGEPGRPHLPPGGIRLHPGGHSANVAIDLAQLGRRDTAVVGGIGEEVLGDYIESELTSRVLQVYPERIPEAHTARNLVLIIKGEDRRFYAELSANTLLTPGHVLKALKETRPDILYQGTVGGLKLIDNQIDAVLSEAKASGVVTVLDVVRPYDGGWNRLQDAFDLIDVFHCNGYEAQVLTGEKDLATACETLARKGAGLVIITLGPEGLVAGWSGNLLRVPVFVVDSVDPTGAGDAFCAGVIDSLLDHPDLIDDIRGLTVEDAKTMLFNGSAAGAACVTSTGATSAVTRENVDDLMNEQGDRVRAGIRAGRRLI